MRANVLMAASWLLQSPTATARDLNIRPSVAAVTAILRADIMREN